MSNRQLVIVGSFALACCVVIRVTFRGAGTKPPPQPDEDTTPGRYQMVGVRQGEQQFLVILDTSTGVTWQRRLQGDLHNPEGWNPIGSPSRNAKLWTPTTVSAI